MSCRKNLESVKTYINNLLKSFYHRSFLDILQDYRLKEAKKMILENQYKISEIAEKVGYHDISYFIRVFKKKYWGNTEQLWKILNIVGKK